MILLSLEASDKVIVLASSMMSKMFGCATTSLCLSSSPTSSRNVLILQVFWAGSHSTCVEAWLLIMELVAEVLFCSRCNCTRVVTDRTDCVIHKVGVCERVVTLSVFLVSSN